MQSILLKRGPIDFLVTAFSGGVFFHHAPDEKVVNRVRGRRFAARENQRHKLSSVSH